MKKYNIVDYWNTRKNPCTKDVERFVKLTKLNLSFVKLQVSGCKKILDFGPGYGRVFSAYIGVKEVVGLDVTRQHEEKLIEESKKQKFLFKFICKKYEVDKLEFDDKEFDAVVSSQVFLHQPPDIIENIMKELIRVGKKVIVITYMDTKKNYDTIENYSKDNRYCFNYNYYKICKMNGWDIYEKHKSRNQIMFVYKERSHE